jgi:transposase-like protein
MAKKTNFTNSQKVAIVREHLIEGVAVSVLCDKHGITPVTYYNWQRTLFENAAVCFDRQPNAANVRRQESAAAKKIEKLEEKLQAKNEVIAELIQENLQAKKDNGEL